MKNKKTLKQELEVLFKKHKIEKWIVCLSDDIRGEVRTDGADMNLYEALGLLKTGQTHLENIIARNMVFND